MMQSPSIFSVRRQGAATLNRATGVVRRNSWRPWYASCRAHTVKAYRQDFDTIAT